jgi:thymidylate synthase (FAD)
LARINLPVSLYTEWYWKINLHNLLHFLKLRLDPTAQYEIRVYAEAIAEIVKIAVPITWEAFEDFMLYAKNFSRAEQEVLKTILAELPSAPDWEAIGKSKGLSSREVTELLEKVALKHEK